MDIPEALIELERAAVEAHAGLAGLEGEAYVERVAVWREAATAVQTAIAEHAREAGVDRYELEMAVKQAVRRPDTPAA
ncbi:hypothetical protein [Streptomyces acidiscabies]|uniref:ChaB n=1 Tax=Streptomyces acidiscabies TaxID=42234 RepID=A0ABU4LW07_9ACTN|nr:hypothetical protein [Streptomyces acidiscabies]MDX3019885.1 hypothetical protein [Streptomyces acidiscabies]